MITFCHFKCSDYKLVADRKDYFLSALEELPLLEVQDREVAVLDSLHKLLGAAPGGTPVGAVAGMQPVVPDTAAVVVVVVEVVEVAAVAVVEVDLVVAERLPVCDGKTGKMDSRSSRRNR